MDILNHSLNNLGFFVVVIVGLWQKHGPVWLWVLCYPQSPVQICLSVCSQWISLLQTSIMSLNSDSSGDETQYHALSKQGASSTLARDSCSTDWMWRHQIATVPPAVTPAQCLFYSSGLEFLKDVNWFLVFCSSCVSCLQMGFVTYLISLLLHGRSMFNTCHLHTDQHCSWTAVTHRIVL